jgi:DNA modification methylase
MQMRQPRLFDPMSDKIAGTCRERLVELFRHDLDFHGEDSTYASHHFHSFPAKFPPQLPAKFIEHLTGAGDIVLDPMVGSGTTVLEALLANRRGVGFDIDPLAVLISKVKTTPLRRGAVGRIGDEVLERAERSARTRRQALLSSLDSRWDRSTGAFVDYWFAKDVQVELAALVDAIQQVREPGVRAFLELAFSAVIITKSGGVSFAFDLAHTRPHRAKIAVSQNGEVIFGHDLLQDPSPRVKLLTKSLRSPLDEFRKRLANNQKHIPPSELGSPQPSVAFGDAQALPLLDSTVDLIVTSPPYASNAIDYMRAHKFSLVWLGYDVGELGTLRREYVGGESLTEFTFHDLPPHTSAVVGEVSERDPKKGLVLHRYYSEMTRVIREMLRVLRPGKPAIVVVGSSLMRGVDTQTGQCLAEIGESLGFEVPAIGMRNLDRDRRMLPAGETPDLNSQIQQRMHQESVIGFLKPGPWGLITS